MQLYFIKITTAIERTGFLVISGKEFIRQGWNCTGVLAYHPVLCAVIKHECKYRTSVNCTEFAKNYEYFIQLHPNLCHDFHCY